MFSWSRWSGQSDCFGCSFINGPAGQAGLDCLAALAGLVGQASLDCLAGQAGQAGLVGKADLTGPAGMACLAGLSFPADRMFDFDKGDEKEKENIVVCCHRKFDEFADGKRCVMIFTMLLIDER